MKTKCLFSLLFAAIAVALTMSLKVSAATWNETVTNRVGAGTVEVTLDDTQAAPSGQILVADGAQLIVNGSISNLANSISVNLDQSATLVWNASVVGSGSASISIVGFSGPISISNCTINTSTSLSITTSTGKVEFDNVILNVSSGSANALSISNAGKLEIKNSEFSALDGSALLVTYNNDEVIITDSDFKNTGSYYPAISCSGNLTVNGNNTEIESGCIGIENNSGTLTLNGGNISGGSTMTDSGIVVEGSLEMSGGSVKGASGIRIDGGNTVNIFGGKIEATGSGSDAGVYIMGSRTPQVTIGGTAEIDGGSTNGVLIGNSSADLLITNGKISGFNGLYQSISKPVTITGGTFDGKGNVGAGIFSSTNRAIKIIPTASTPILIKGKGNALSLDDDYTSFFEVNNVKYFLAGGDYNGADAASHTEVFDLALFDGNSAYKYIKFFASVPYVAPAPEPEPAPVYTPVEIIYQPIPLIDYPDPENLPEWIEVTATLNKSGTVNGEETAEDVAAAHRRAARQGGGKIKLIIPEGGKGISKTAMAKIFKAAEETPIYLTFDLYETGGNAESVGNVIFKLTGKTGQVLTRVDFDSVRIDSAESDIAKRFKTDILGSFEFAHKYGWGETATVTLNPESLGIDIHNGQKVTAYTYNAKTKKWYKITGKAVDDVVILATSQSGVITFVK
jgi:hypothetical protein